MWYYARDEQQFGPLEEAVFSRLIGTGAVGPNTLVWREGMADWVRYSALLPPASNQPPAGDAVHCVECQRPVATGEAVSYEGRWVCGSCKEIFFQRLREGHLSPSETLPYANVMPRFGALMLDSLLFALLFGLILLVEVGVALAQSGGGEISDTMAAIIGLTLIFGGYLFLPVYMTWFMGRYGATPGKMALKLKVVRGDGSKLTYLRAFGRTLGFLLSCNTMYLGFLVAFFDSEKRTLHDIICDTRVVQAG